MNPAISVFGLALHWLCHLFWLNQGQPRILRSSLYALNKSERQLSSMLNAIPIEEECCAAHLRGLK